MANMILEQSEHETAGTGLLSDIERAVIGVSFGTSIGVAFLSGEHWAGWFAIGVAFVSVKILLELRRKKG